AVTTVEASIDALLVEIPSGANTRTECDVGADTSTVGLILTVTSAEFAFVDASSALSIAASALTDTGGKAWVISVMENVTTATSGVAPRPKTPVTTMLTWAADSGRRVEIMSAVSDLF